MTIQNYIDSNYKVRKIKNFLICIILGLSAIIATIPLFSVIIEVVINGFSSLNVDFFISLPKPVGETGGGIAHAIVGTLVLVTLASLLGIPIGLITGIFLSEFSKNKLGEMIRFSIDILSSIPSIVIGIFIYTLVVIPMKSFSALSGGLALAIIMIPTVSRTTEELLKLVPSHIREAGLALGLSRWKVIIFIVFKGSIGGIMTGVMLAIARISGETAPLLFTALGNIYWTTSLKEPIASLPVQIYTYAISPFEEWHNMAWASALVLIVFVLTLNIFSKILLRTNYSRDTRN